MSVASLQVAKIQRHRRPGIAATASTTASLGWHDVISESKEDITSSPAKKPTYNPIIEADSDSGSKLISREHWRDYTRSVLLLKNFDLTTLQIQLSIG